jgi:small subunit ribosomal protein S11
LPFRVDQHAFARDKPPHLLHVHAGPGNTILTLTSDMGKTLVATSGGTAGFKKSHRGGAEAAFQACQQLVQKTKDKHVNVASLSVRLKGFGAGREATFRALRALTEWKIVRMTDVTPIPFSGCRSKKERRL